MPLEAVIACEALGAFAFEDVEVVCFSRYRSTTDHYLRSIRRDGRVEDRVHSWTDRPFDISGPIHGSELPNRRCGDRFLRVYRLLVECERCERDERNGNVGVYGASKRGSTG